jgi:hypothetical protein
MDYGEVLSKAWKVIWKHKVLWIFGILASFGQGSGGGGGNGGGSGWRNSGNGANPFSNLPPEWSRTFQNSWHFIQNIHWWGWVLFALAILLLIIFFAFLATIGKTGLILGTHQADQSDEKIHFGKLLHDSFHYFWRVFWFNFIVGIAILVLILAISLPFVLLGFLTLGLALICLIPFLCLFVPISWLIFILLEQSIIAIVVKDIGMIEGLKHGWRVCLKNPWQLILMGIILGIGGGIVGFILAIPVILATLPLIIPFITGSLKSLTTVVTISLLCCCIYLPFLYLLNGILTAYIQSSWTLTFLRLAGKASPEPVAPVEVLPEVPPSV